MSSPSPSEVSRLLAAWGAGSQRALEDLLPLVYRELRTLAARHLRRERRNHTLQPTALVNEAFLRLVGQDRVAWQGRAHFLAIAAQAMRRVLIDHARRHVAARRGGGVTALPLEPFAAAPAASTVDLLALDEALTKLERLDPRAARVVEERCFAGATVEETAEALGIAPITVMRDWKMAQAWLQRQLSGAKGEGSADGP